MAEVLTCSAEGDLPGAEEEEVVALLHAGEEPPSGEVLHEGPRQPLVIPPGELHPAAVLLAEVLQRLRRGTAAGVKGGRGGRRRGTGS